MSGSHCPPSAEAFPAVRGCGHSLCWRQLRLCWRGTPESSHRELMLRNRCLGSCRLATSAHFWVSLHRVAPAVSKLQFGSCFGKPPHAGLNTVPTTGHGSHWPAHQQGSPPCNGELVSTNQAPQRRVWLYQGEVQGHILEEGSGPASNDKSKCPLSQLSIMYESTQKDQTS